VSAPTRLRHRVGAYVREHALWSAGDRVAVALSGGADSVVLLDLLAETRAWHGAQLSVVTVDHGVHSASAAHATFAKALAAERGLDCVVASLHLGEHASERACRDGRRAVYDALDVDRVALAHHADDQAETVLINLLRGSGARGLGGMRPRRGRLVRPLLGEPRAALRDWAEARSLAWVEDPTNADPRYTRNRVRAELMPVLEAIRPGASAVIARSSAWCAADDDALQALCEELDPELDVTTLCALEPAVALRWLGRWAPGTSLVERQRMLALAREGRGRCEVRGIGLLTVKDGRFARDP